MKRCEIMEWKDWVELCEYAHLDPYETANFAKDLGDEIVLYVYCGEWEYQEEKEEEKKGAKQ